MVHANGDWSAFERARAREIAEHQSEIEQLKARVRELEGTNTALGNVIELLRESSPAEAETAPTKDPKGS